MNDAFDLMLGVYRAPHRATMLHGRALPQRIVEVFRVAAGDAGAVADARNSTGLDDAELGEAAVLLLHHLLFFDGADHYRVLGVDEDADDAQIKRHYRALMRWLHPDRDPDNLHSVFAERVNRAWNALRTPQRRAAYDDARTASAMPSHGVPAGGAAAATLDIGRWAGDGKPWLSGRAIRTLPQVVAAAAGLVALAMLALVVWLQRTESARSASAPAPLPSLVAPSLVTPPPASPQPAAPPLIDTDAVPLQVPPPTLFASAASALSDAVAAPAAADTGRPAPATDARRVPVAAKPLVETPRPPAPKRVATMPATLSEDEILAFVERFESLYAGDDVDAFLALFGDDAVGNGSDGLRELSIDYRRLFSTSARRTLRLRDMRWQIDAGRAVGHGRYDAHVDATAKTPQDSQGQILLALRRDANGLRITRLNHSVGR